MHFIYYKVVILHIRFVFPFRPALIRRQSVAVQSTRIPKVSFMVVFGRGLELLYSTMHILLDFQLWTSKISAILSQVKDLCVYSVRLKR